jgi:hypothetical protein
VAGPILVESVLGEEPRDSILARSRRDLVRRPEFKVRTEIVGEGADRIVRRIAEGEASGRFLERTVAREKRAEEFYGRSARVIRGRLIGGAVEYPFVPFASLQDRISIELSRGEHERALDLVRQYVDFLDGLPTRELVPEKFIQLTGAEPGAHHCFERGPADCIPRNILVDREDWHVIDHEWMMAFPVPVDWVLYRGIYSLIYALQDEMAKSVDGAHPIALVTGRRQRLFSPLSWISILDSRPTPTQTLEDWYFGWQHQVLTSPVPRSLRPSRHAYARVPGRLNPTAFASDVSSLVQSLRHARRRRAAPPLELRTDLLLED